MQLAVMLILTFVLPAQQEPNFIRVRKLACIVAYRSVDSFLLSFDN